MYYYFYKITNIINNKIYYGVHKTTNLEDDYLGSGIGIKSAIKKYGKDKFIKEIVKYFNDEEEMYNYEKEFVTEEIVKDPNTYNMTIGGSCGFYHINSIGMMIGENNPMKREDIKEKMSKSWKTNYDNLSIDEKQRRTEIAKLNLKKAQNKWTGSTHTEETKKKISESNTGKTHSLEARKKMSISAKNKPEASEHTKMLRKKNAKRIYESKLANGNNWAYNRKGAGKKYNFKHITGIIENNITCRDLYEKYKDSMKLKYNSTFTIPKLKNNKKYKGWFCFD